jgi:NADH dehydrogenase FAD-containing subunit
VTRLFRFHLLYTLDPCSLYHINMATRKCAAVVVGAGPAGVAVMGNLLERQLGSIAWIDPSFAAGRVHSKYREVPRFVLGSG